GESFSGQDAAHLCCGVGGDAGGRTPGDRPEARPPHSTSSGPGDHRWRHPTARYRPGRAGMDRRAQRGYHSVADVRYRRLDEQFAGVAHTSIEKYRRRREVMMAQEFAVDQILQAVQAHLASRHVVTLATSYHDEPSAATAFYVARGLDLYVCQGERARPLAHMLSYPRTGFAVDDRR